MSVDQLIVEHLRNPHHQLLAGDHMDMSVGGEAQVRRRKPILEDFCGKRMDNLFQLVNEMQWMVNAVTGYHLEDSHSPFPGNKDVLSTPKAAPHWYFCSF